MGFLYKKIIMLFTHFKIQENTKLIDATNIHVLYLWG